MWCGVNNLLLGDCNCKVSKSWRVIQKLGHVYVTLTIRLSVAVNW